MNDARSIPAALTIAGSDSGGGAGIQADLKTFAALDVFGTSALTCLTAQNPSAVTAIAAMDPAMVVAQIKAVRAGFPLQAAKTGMLYSAAIIEAVAEAMEGDPLPNLVVDPVMVATSGARLLREDAVAALSSRLIPKARVITPNRPEAEVLWQHPIDTVDALSDAARAIGEAFGVACVVKGGHLVEDGSGRADPHEVVDVLYVDGALHVFRGPVVAAVETHGTGCTFSAALAAWLARGVPLVDATRRAKEFVADALRHSWRVGSHTPLGISRR